MGMYKQIRGWLNINSMGNDAENKLTEILNEAKSLFELRTDLDRTWVCNDTLIHFGANGSAWLFIGTELKNYDDSVDEWIKTLLKCFPNAEGRIDYQYEEEDEDTGSRYLLIYNGKIIKDGIGETWCKGYGNTFIY